MSNFVLCEVAAFFFLRSRNWNLIVNFISCLGRLLGELDFLIWGKSFSFWQLDHSLLHLHWVLQENGYCHQFSMNSDCFQHFDLCLCAEAWHVISSVCVSLQYSLCFLHFGLLYSRFSIVCVRFWDIYVRSHSIHFWFRFSNLAWYFLSPSSHSLPEISIAWSLSLSTFSWEVNLTQDLLCLFYCSRWLLRRVTSIHLHWFWIVSLMSSSSFSSVVSSHHQLTRSCSFVCYDLSQESELTSF